MIITVCYHCDFHIIATRVQFSWVGNPYHFIFMDAHTHAHYALYSFVVSQLPPKTVKIGPLENFLLYIQLY